MHWDVDFVNEYHDSCNRFVTLKPGVYYMHIDTRNNYDRHVNFIINFNTNAALNRKIQPEKLTLGEQRILFSSTMHSFLTVHGIEGFPNKNKKDRKVSIGHFFSDIGYGIVEVSANKASTESVGMSINPK